MNSPKRTGTGIGGIYFVPIDGDLVVEAGRKLEGHVHVSAHSLVKGVKVELEIKGEWSVNWSSRLDPDLIREAKRLVADPIRLTIFEGTLLTGEHGIPVSIDIPGFYPPSVMTPTRTLSGILVPITAKCVYTLLLNVSFLVKNTTNSKSNSSLLTILLPSFIKSNLLSLQPPPLSYSSIFNETAPATLPTHLANISPFITPILHPLDFSCKSLEPPTSIITIIDKGTVRFDLDIPRLRHFVADPIPITLAILPKNPPGLDVKVHKVTCAIVAHLLFHFPPNLIASAAPSAKALAVRLASEDFIWSKIPPNKESLKANPESPNAPHLAKNIKFTNTCAPQYHESDTDVPPELFKYMQPPTLFDDENALPLTCVHTLRISVTLADSFSHPVEKEKEAGVAPELPEDPALVIDVPIMLISKGAKSKLWTFPVVQRGLVPPENPQKHELSEWSSSQKGTLRTVTPPNEPEKPHVENELVIINMDKPVPTPPSPAPTEEIKKLEIATATEEFEFEEEMVEEDPACVSTVIHEPTPTKPITEPKLAIPRRESISFKGVDDEGRLLPLKMYSGKYKVLYPYFPDSRPDEIRLGVGDDVTVLYFV